MSNWRYRLVPSVITVYTSLHLSPQLRGIIHFSGSSIIDSPPSDTSITQFSCSLFHIVLMVCCCVNQLALTSCHLLCSYQYAPAGFTLIDVAYSTWRPLPSWRWAHHLPHFTRQAAEVAGMALKVLAPAQVAHSAGMLASSHVGADGDGADLGV